MKCPNCKDTNLSLSERKGIEIDFCPDCRGIWLDRGELDKILERGREKDPETRRDLGFQSSQKHYKRKKSFLEDLFD